MNEAPMTPFARTKKIPFVLSPSKDPNHLRLNPLRQAQGERIMLIRRWTKQNRSPFFLTQKNPVRPEPVEGPAKNPARPEPVEGPKPPKQNQAPNPSKSNKTRSVPNQFPNPQDFQATIHHE
jgi:hypothetical protein